ncbi:HlyD family efflux transporter periplasmic adaptor subunit [Undibacterium sp. 14-3-2]|nr:HlyD family efflux transporter periplasmic adaptor subunit [Undibacterium sp. 14-3-2]MBK1891915.1 HlyD family efflux transporter periplasmic adaptor subunit [Undibacterium sp. 14-3-2]
MMLKFNMKPMALILFSLISVCSPGVFAHGDENHDEQATPTKSKNATTAATHIAQEAPQRLADASLFVPKSVQRRLGIRTVQTQVSNLTAGIELNGKLIADPETSGRIQAPFSGSVQPGPKGMPVDGRKVVKGEVLAYLQPVASAIEQGNQKAQLAELDAQLAIAERKLKRYEQLEGAVPQKEIDSARIERDALRQRSSFVAGSVNSAQPLRAPVSGILSASNRLQAGQIVDAREVLFEIVDPNRLAVEALAYDPGIVGTLQSASARVGGIAVELTFVGGGRQLREQALPLLFRVTRPDATLVIGQPVKVMVRTSRGIQGAAVSLQAVTKLNSGETAVWVHTAPERFAVRKIRTQALDAVNIAVVDGLHDGERVVSDGASLLSQVR